MDVMVLCEAAAVTAAITEASAPTTLDEWPWPLRIALYAVGFCFLLMLAAWPLRIALLMLLEVADEWGWRRALREKAVAEDQQPSTRQSEPVPDDAPEANADDDPPAADGAKADEDPEGDDA